jgi:hypothetical protein|tara:strand:- start:320 stop:541 length:222 start_codon:yes stop_codon:yes gene_type:complete
MEGLLLLGGLVFLIASTLTYVYLIETNKIKPHISARYTNRARTQRGNFWDSENQMFYKWHQIEELKKIRGVKK